MKIAVIGAGVSGIVAARILATRHQVTLFESADYAGGHANTFDVELDGRLYPVDTGFMVFNERTYPLFCRLLDLLGVESQPSDMSFSVSCSRTGIEYQGSSLSGLFAQRRNLVRPEFLRMLRQIVRFNSAATRAATSGDLERGVWDGKTVGDFLRPLRLGRLFRSHYLVPMASAIWSTRPSEILDFPARFMIGFFHNHGLVQLSDRPKWRTIRGGSRRYVHRLTDPLGTAVRLATPVHSVRRDNDGCDVVHGSENSERFDQVVFATHADQTLRMLRDADATEHSVLSAFSYQDNVATLHTDASILPRRRRAWASWNYRLGGSSSGDAAESAVSDSPAAVTYDLSRLQNHASTTPLLLSLNMADQIAPAKVMETFTYAHPAYRNESSSAQTRHGEISGLDRRVHFCGAYWGYGFHEDGVRSALAVTEAFGLGVEACTAACTKAS